MTTDHGVTEIELDVADYPQFWPETLISDELERHLKRTRPDLVKVKMVVNRFGPPEWKGPIYEVDGIDVSD